VKIKTEKSKPSKQKSNLINAKKGKWDFCLFVAGQNQKSVTAFNNLTIICNTQLMGMYNIKVIDILSHPHLARAHQILAVPTLIRKSPLPVRNIIGDLSNTERVLLGLDIFTTSGVM